jgi:diguanylate cyclase (GGDEF)-like protein
MAHVPTELALRPRRLSPPEPDGASALARPAAPVAETGSQEPAGLAPLRWAGQDDEGALGAVSGARAPDEADGTDEPRRAWTPPSLQPEVVVMLDERDQVAWASPSIEQLTGRAATAVVGSPGLALFHLEDREGLSRLLAEMRGSPLALSMTLRVTTVAGDSVPVEAEATNLVDEPGLNTVSLRLRRLARGARPSRPRSTSRPHHAQTVLDSLQEGVVVMLDDGTVLSCNEAAPQLLGTTRAGLVGRNINDAIASAIGTGGVVLDEEGSPIDPLSDRALLTLDQPDSPGTVRGHLRTGAEVRWLRCHTTEVNPERAGEDPGARHLLLSISDVTALRRADQERREALAALADEQEFLRALVRNLDAGVAACDAKGMLTVTNATFRLFGDYRADQVTIGAEPTVEGMYWPDGTPLAPEEHPLRQALAGSRVSRQEIVFRPASGAPTRVVTTSATVLKSEDGRLLGAVAGFQDVTDAKETARELTELALHDPLTGCANRILLNDRVALAAEFAKRDQAFVGLLVIDLDDFKLVNDTHGHLVGDEVLVGVGRRLRSVVRPGDTVARYGGDEFVVLCQVSGGEAELAAVRARVAARLNEPFRIGQMTLEVGASIGSALLPGSEADLNKLLRAADAEMYEEKLARASGEPAGEGAYRRRRLGYR